MTINTNSRKISYTGNGTVKEFSFPFKVFNASQVQVTSTINSVTSQLNYITDFLVTLDSNYTGTIVCTLPPAAGAVITIYRVVTSEQTLDLRYNETMPSQAVEDAFDKAHMLIQQNEEEISRCIKFPINETLNITEMQLPDSETRKGKYLAWNEAGAIEAQSSPSTYYNETKVYRDESQTLLNDIAIIYSDTDYIKSETLNIKSETEAVRDETETLKNQTSQLKDETQIIKNDTAVIKTETQAIRDSITSVQMTDVNNAIASHRNESVAVSHPEINTAIQNAVPTGTIIMFYGNYAPAGYLDTINATVSRTTFANLWAFAQAQNLIVAEGTKNWTNRNFNKFGDGDGSTTFSLPNFNGSFMRHYNTGDSVGQWLDQQILVHSHNYLLSADGSDAGNLSYAINNNDGKHYVTPTAATGGAENLPWTTIMRFCIKY